MLPPEVLDLLQQWWKARRRSALVVSRPLTTRSVRAAARNLAVILPISGRISPSTIAGILYVGEARAAFRSSGARQASSYTSNLESEQVIAAPKRKGRPCRSIQKTRSQYYQTLEKGVRGCRMNRSLPPGGRRRRTCGAAACRAAIICPRRPPQELLAELRGFLS
jgi:hypothetical protein